MRLLLAVAAAISLTLGTAGRSNAAVVLNFAGLNGDSIEEVRDYYNGGTGSLGSGPGPNFGISFAGTAIVCSGEPGGRCSSAAIPGGPGANFLQFTNNGLGYINVAGGFDTGFSFFYSTIGVPGSISIWSGLSGTGDLLATLVLPDTSSTPQGDECFGTAYCPYVPLGVAFDGVAKSVDFNGSVDVIAFANVTLGSDQPGEVPEPATIALFGIGLAGLAAARRRKPA